MTAISNFPDDDHLWMIKLVDEFTLPNGKTTSTSVSVLLQKLPFDDPGRLIRLKESEIHDILRERKTDANPIFLTPCPRVLVGYLPGLIYVGAVYQRQRHVGELPTTSRRIELPQVEDSGEDVELADELPGPEGWEAGPFRVLNRFEFSYDWKRFARSRCLVCRSEGVEYIIPRTLIFKTFYANHYKLARAFTNGPWPDQLPTLIYMHDLDSGLKTQIHPETGHWNIILQLKVPAPLAGMLACYLFDDHAKACAESIYSKARQDRGARGINPWYASAKIPFRPSDTPFVMDVRGYSLPAFSSAPEEGRVQRFFVTRIPGSSFPDYVPEIGWEFFISGASGKDITPVNEPQPMSNAQAARPGNSQTVIESTEDSNLEYEAIALYEDSSYWINPPKLVRLKKESSKTYTGEKQVAKTPMSKGDAASPGNNTSSQSALPEARAQILIRDQEKRFQYLQDALAELQTGGHIDSFSVCPPLDRSQMVMRASIECWSFLGEEERISGKWPKRGWRVVPAKSSGEDDFSTQALPRTAFVVEIVHKGNFGYWIEIEYKATGHKSAFIYGLDTDPRGVIKNCIEIIAMKEGKNFQKALQDCIREVGDGWVETYIHQHESEKSAKLEKNSILKIIARMGD